MTPSWNLRIASPSITPTRKTICRPENKVKFAALLNIIPNYFSKLLRGARPGPEFMHPDTTIIQKIAKAMGVKPGDIPWVDVGQRAVASMLDDTIARGPTKDMDEAMRKLKEQFPPEYIRLWMNRLIRWHRRPRL